ncbi:MAG: hypothetical protein OHK0017_02790 [Patescibacteria group bacterium]
MPLHRQKVNSTSNKQLVFLKKPKNERRAPGILVSVVGIFLVVGVTGWALNQNSQAKPAPQVASVREKADGSLVYDENNSKAQAASGNNSPQTTDNAVTPANPTPTPAEEPKTPEIKTEPAQVKIEPSAKAAENLDIPEMDCSFTYLKTNPTQVTLVNDTNYFWVPNTNCKSDKVLLMQLVSAKPAPTYPEVEVQSLDKDSENVLIYWADKRTSSNIDIDKYLVQLTTFLKNGKLYFSTSTAFDTLYTTKTNGDTYYLAGNCDGGKDGPCILWGLPAKASLVTLLTKNGVALTNDGEPNHIQPGQYLKFAKVQDKLNKIALILYKGDSLDLIYIDLANNYQISETKTYSKGTQSFNKYFR